MTEATISGYLSEHKDLYLGGLGLFMGLRIGQFPSLSPVPLRFLDAKRAGAGLVLDVLCWLVRPPLKFHCLMFPSSVGPFNVINIMRLPSFPEFQGTSKSDACRQRLCGSELTQTLSLRPLRCRPRSSSLYNNII